MLRNIKIFLYNIKKKLFGSQVEQFKKGGGIVGNNVHIFASFLDPKFPWLIKIGDNVTITDVKILCHDASTQKKFGFTKIGKVTIGNNVFIGAKSVILPNVTIGDDVIIGAGSIVSKSIPSNSIAVGNPCKPIGNYDEYMDRQMSLMTDHNVWDNDPRKLSKYEKDVISKQLEKGIGFIR